MRTVTFGTVLLVMDLRLNKNVIDEENVELMVITMEECGELIQVCAKALRSGKFKNNEKLTEEVGDVMTMVGLLIEYDLIDFNKVEERIQVKLAKLAKWSNLVDDNEEYKETRNDDIRSDPNPKRNRKSGTKRKTDK